MKNLHTHNPDLMLGSEENYSLLANSIHDTLMLIQDEKIVFCNQKMGTLGYSAQELYDLEIWKLLAPYHLAKAKGYYHMRTYDSKIPNFYEIDVIKKDGAYVNTRLGVIPVNYRGRYAIQLIMKDISEEISNRRALVLSERKYRRLFDDSLAGLLTIQDGHVIFVNDLPLRTLDYTREELRKISFINIIHEEDKSLTLEIYDKLMNGHCNSARLRLRVVARNGEVFWVETACNVGEYEGKKALQVITLNINAQVQKEEREEGLLDHYQVLAEQSPDGIMVSMGQDIAYVNQSLAAMFGYSIEEMEGRSIYEFIALQEVEDIKRLIDKLMQEDDVPRFLELTMLARDGRELNCQLAHSLIVFRESPAYQYTIRDITKLKKDQEKLQLQSDILSNINDCIIVADSAYHVLMWNKGAENLFELSEEEVLGKRLAKVFRKFDPELQNQEMVYAITQGIDWQGQIDFVQNASGELKTFSISITAIKDEWGSIEYIVGIATDVTELVESRQEAREANHAKSEFLTNMSHEIRTPLVGIIGFCELLSQEYLNPPQMESVNIIKQCSEQLLELVNNILDLSKIEAKKVEINNKTVNLRQMLEHTIQSTQPSIAEKNLRLLLYVEPDVPTTIYADEVKLRQIITNLVVNAIKFTDCGLIKVEVSSDGKSEEDQIFSLRIAVHDTGIGVDTQKREKIFAPFVQGDSSTTRRYGGSGLGLAICKELVLAMGGSIWVDENESGGATFTFIIPVVNIQKETQRKVESHKSIKKQENDKFNQLKVLLVEDIKVNRTLITRMLEAMGCEVISAANGREGLELLEKYEADIIFMDMQMPIMNGYEATHILRQSARWEYIPVVALTAYAMTGDIDKCIKAGCNAYLSKPFTFEQLHQVICELIETK